MKKFSSLRHSYQIAIITICVSVVASLLSLVLLIFNKDRYDVSLGFLTGGVIISFLHFLQGVLDSEDEKRGTISLSIMMNAIKMFVLVGVIVILAFMYFRWNLPYINLISFAGIYVVSVITTTIIFIKNKK